jgi:hypothetical protein
MGIRDWLYHRHYWGVPHRREGDSRVIQICYECGKEREIRLDLAPGQSSDQNGVNDELDRDEIKGEGFVKRHLFSS